MRIYRTLTSLETIKKRWLIVIAIGDCIDSRNHRLPYRVRIILFLFLPDTSYDDCLGDWQEYRAGVFRIERNSMVYFQLAFRAKLYQSPFIGVWNTMIRFGFYAVVTILLAELRHALEEERILASTDPLTGALNRRSFSTIAEKKMILAEVNRHPYTLVYIDLDNFKLINDSLGHAAGDMVLKTVVDTMQAQIGVLIF